MTERKALEEYLPGVMRNVREISAVCAAEDGEFALLFPAIEEMAREAALMRCSQARIGLWESALGIVPAGSLYQRRLYIRSILSRTGKLTEDVIKSIVNALTEGGSIISFSGSTITVKVLTPGEGEVFLFTDVKRALLPFVPAHINLTVEKYYSTWGDIKEGFASWGGVNEWENWGAVKNYIGA